MAGSNNLDLLASNLLEYWLQGEWNNLFRDEKPIWSILGKFGYDYLRNFTNLNASKWFHGSNSQDPIKIINSIKNQDKEFLKSINNSTWDSDFKMATYGDLNGPIAAIGKANLDLNFAKTKDWLNNYGEFMSSTDTLSKAISNPSYVSLNAPLLNLLGDRRAFLSFDNPNYSLLNTALPNYSLTSNTKSPVSIGSSSPDYKMDFSNFGLDSIDSMKSALSDSGLGDTPTSNESNFTSGLKDIGASTAGAVANMGVGYGLSVGLGKAFGNSSGGQFAANTVSSIGSTIAGEAASTGVKNLAAGASAGANVGSNIANIFSNAGSLTSLGSAIGNIALDTFDKRKKAKWESGFNLGLTAMSFIPGMNIVVPPIQFLFNGVGHAFGGSIEKGFGADKDMLAKATTYGGAIKKSLEAEGLGGLKYTLWANHDRHKDEAKYYEGRRQYDAVNDIIAENQNKQDIAAGNLAIALVEDLYRAAGGYSQQGTYKGKQGMIIRSKPTTIKIRTSVRLVEPIDEFKDGGSILKGTKVKLVRPIEEFREGGSINVIPEGALHARLHHMENDENITKKGIPVVSEKEGGEIEQLAEIERQEIIFRLEVTKRLEELAKDGSDEAALEAGKLLVEEILYNTIDNTNSLI